MNRKFLRKLYKALLILAAGLWLSLGQKGWAIPFSNQLPGNGQWVSGAAPTYTAGPGGVPGSATLTVSKPTGILWGSAAPNITNVPGSAPGFNIGQSATLTINGGNPVLNVDVTGNPSYIMGTLNAVAGTPVFVANGSGIIVGSGATITAAAGIGLLGYDLSGQASSFTGTVSVFPTTTGSFVTIQSGASILVAAPPAPPGHSGASILVAAPQVNIGIAAPGSITATNFFDVLSGYQFTGYTPSSGTYVTVPSPIAGSTGSITISGPSSGTYSFLNADFVMSSGSITTNGNLILPGGVNTQWGTGNSSNLALGVLTNNGTLSFASDLTGASTTGSIVNNGTILANAGNLNITVGGSITNNPGATINGGGFNVRLKTVGGGINNMGTISGFDSVSLQASNPNQLGPYIFGSISNTGTISITDPHSSTNPASFLNIKSFTGSVFLNGVVNTADPNGVSHAHFHTNSVGNFGMNMNANVTADTVSFSVHNLTGSGVLTAQTVHLNVTGNVRNVVSPTNPLLNGFTIANGPFSSTSIFIDADGIAPQIINLHVNGNATIDSADTSTFVNSVFPIGLTNPVANAGGNLLVNATGNLTVNGSVFLDKALSTDIKALSTDIKALSTDILGLSNAFVFPGGVALKAGGMLTLNTTIDNGYTAVAGPNYQGVFLSAPQIFVSGPFVTNGNTIVHASGPISAAVYVATPVSPVFPSIYTAVLSTTNGPVVSPFPWQ